MAGFGFDEFMIIFVVVFVIVIGMFVLFAVKLFAEWRRNHNSPLVTVQAVVVAKRAHRSHGLNDGTPTTSTSYSITFEIRGGERIELYVPNREYGLIAEHDRGQLQHQGSRYKGFSRTPQDR